MTYCMRYWVSGHVQGVFFRASARQKALSLGLTGWARNHADGRVEVLACGDAAKLSMLHEWLSSGPPHARVSGVQAIQVPAEDIKGFTIL
ncbi:MAG: acylphosphatase [Gammaproteobacteria bacterium]